MREYKTIILGGRSGTSLLLKMLLKTGEFTNWNNNNGEPYKNTSRYIWDYYPDVPDEIFNTCRENWDLVKCPVLGWICDKIIDEYKNPRFIYLDRNLDEICKSAVFASRNDKGGRFDEAETKVEKLTEYVKNYYGRLPRDKYDSIWMFHHLQFLKTEEDLKDYPHLLRIDFNDFMFKFIETCDKICKFLEIKPLYSEWKEMRWIRYSPSRKGLDYYKRMQNANKKIS